MVGAGGDRRRRGLPFFTSSFDPGEVDLELTSGLCATAPTTPKPPAFVTAATTSRQWLKARMGDSTPSISGDPCLHVGLRISGARTSGVRGRRRGVLDVEEEVVGVAPPPVLAGLIGADQWVVGLCVPVRSGVAVRGVVTAADVPHIMQSRRCTHAPRRVDSPRSPRSTAAHRCRPCRDACMSQPSPRLSSSYGVGRYRASVTDTPPDPVAFPELDDDQLAVIAAYGQRRTVQPARSCSPRPTPTTTSSSSCRRRRDPRARRRSVITRHGARRFLGEVSLLTRQRPYLTARVVEGGEIIVVPADVFRAHVVADARVSDTILEAFLARRAVLLVGAADTLLIVGSSSRRRRWRCASTPPATASPTAGSTPTQSDVATLLDGLGVTAADLPIAIRRAACCGGPRPGELAPSWGSPSTPCPSGASTWWSSAPARPGWRRRSTPRRRGCAR